MNRMLEQWHIFFSGRVQRVGFRYTAFQVASRMSFSVSELTGWVQNLPDGRVEMVVEGTRNQLRDYVAKVSEATYGQVSDTEIDRGPATGQFTQFEIRRG